MKLSDVERAYNLLPDLEEARRKLIMAQNLSKIDIREGIGRELADYAPPSNIGVAFHTIKTALIELHQKELDGVIGALKVLGVECPESSTPLKGRGGEVRDG